MRTLKFIIKSQIIELDPDCDFSNLIPGTEGYLQARFIFSPEWMGCAKVAAFYSTMGKEIGAQILDVGGTCMIPAEVLAKQKFKVQVIGKKRGYKILTNKVLVNQNGGKE